ncbi:serine/threonine protein kinase [Amylocarpus encephaloides]|uniref:Serine/threonine protein kinase n=1 Tax=Amylocarpus encephaloides TaxID=45428 RepID=A0A9P8C335_9HELO|nr:serine/threonine protein kinase [Amylocarpus encephaloides]
MKREIPVSRREFISLGAVGWVHKINNHIVLKSPREEDYDKFTHENKFYSILELHPPCPDLPQSFLRVPTGNFLAFYSGGTLDERLREHQIRDEGPHGGSLIEIMELSSAVTWLESLGYVHTDIRLPNLLLNDHEHLKLTDFDCVQELGTPTEGSAAPWARVLGTEAGDECGSFGDNGARYEQFAIGSVLYMMTRGHEPYDDGSIAPEDAPVVVDLFQQMKFPPLGEDKLDRVIKQCWKGEYETLKDLADETELLPGASSFPRATAFDDGYCSKVRRECEELVERGILDEN